MQNLLMVCVRNVSRSIGPRWKISPRKASWKASGITLIGSFPVQATKEELHEASYQALGIDNTCKHCLIYPMKNWAVRNETEYTTRLTGDPKTVGDSLGYLCSAFSQCRYVIAYGTHCRWLKQSIALLLTPFNLYDQFPQNHQNIRSIIGSELAVTS